MRLLVAALQHTALKKVVTDPNWRRLYQEYLSSLPARDVEKGALFFLKSAPEFSGVGAVFRL